MPILDKLNLALNNRAKTCHVVLIKVINIVVLTSIVNLFDVEINWSPVLESYFVEGFCKKKYKNVYAHFYNIVLFRDIDYN